MIKVLGLRPIPQSPHKKVERFNGEAWRFERIQDVFEDSKRHEMLNRIPRGEHWNLYFTVAQCFEGEGRKLKEQWVIPFDIDNIKLEGDPLENARQAVSAALSVLELDISQVAALFSGNGAQFFVYLDEPIVYEEWFDEHRDSYADLCSSMDLALTREGIQGELDRSVFSKSRLMRFPDTENRKEGKEYRYAKVLSSGEHPVTCFLTKKQVNAYIPDADLLNYPKPDAIGVMTGCQFLVHAKAHQNQTSEPQWYAALSITARLPGGDRLSHEISQDHANYSEYETDNKIQQAKSASGPRTCANINTLWDGCNTCPHFGKITSPIMIKRDNYVSSKDFGYRQRKVDKNGNVTIGPPAYDDIIVRFGEDHPYRVISDSKQVVVFNGKHWEYRLEQELCEWLNDLVEPTPSSAELNEFLSRLRATNGVRLEAFEASRSRLMNFQNGVLDIRNMELKEHSPSYGFMHVLPFAYNRMAECPRWEQFLAEITNDPSVADLLEEFAGYAISGDECWAQKALLLIGGGANGKSVFMETLAEVVGPENVSALNIKHWGQPVYNHMMLNKLFNYSEETSSEALKHKADEFKNVVSGGSMMFKQLYQQPFMGKSRAKVILAANNIPLTAENTEGIYRRLIIVHLNKRFTPDMPGFDFFLTDKLKKELSGICNRLIKAYKRLLENRRFSNKEEQDRVIEEYKQDSNEILQFTQEYTVPDEDARTSTKDLYDEYKIFSERFGYKARNYIQFSKELSKLDQLAELRFKSNGIRGYKLRVRRE